MPTVETSPPALRCLQDFIALIDGTPVEGDPRPRKELRDWLTRLAGDAASVAVLNSARDRGASLHGLLFGAAMQRFVPAWFDQSLAGLRFGPVRLGRGRVQEIDELLAGAEAVESALMGTTAGASELRMIKGMLKELDAIARVEGKKPREVYVRGRGGKLRKKKFKIKGGIVVVTEVEAGVVPLHAALRRPGRGAHGDAALGVFLTMVLGHLRAVAPDTSAKLAVDVVATGFQLPDQTRGGAADPAEALRARVIRSLARPEHVERAKILAGMLGIPFDVG